jgi:hypothetical protein
VIEEDDPDLIEVAHLGREGIVERPVEAHDAAHGGTGQALVPRPLAKRWRMIGALCP